jgi:hypothetical protein
MLYKNSSLHINGGIIESLQIRGHSSIVIDKGDIGAIKGLSNSDTQQITMYCDLDSLGYTNIFLSSSDYHNSIDLLTGNYLNGDPFSIELYHYGGWNDPIDSFIFIPEPATLMLFGIGALLIRKR